MISFERKFIFLHYPKTAGNSLQNHLIQFSSDEKVCEAEHQDGLERFQVVNHALRTRKHSKLKDYENALGTDKLNEYFVFSTIRNPWDRLISRFFSPHQKSRFWDRNEFIKLVENEDTFEDFYVTLSNKKLDYIIRFESLDSDYSTVCELLSISKARLIKRNASIHEAYKYYYDDELIEMVARKFHKEIELGNYSF
ncbi:sulfotransferase family protein [Alteromonas sp. ZYF713]|nr:sulfotransferase family protein [Alteromonas sp. ZYF713]